MLRVKQESCAYQFYGYILTRLNQTKVYTAPEADALDVVAGQLFYQHCVLRRKQN